MFLHLHDFSSKEEETMAKLNNRDYWRMIDDCTAKIWSFFR